MADDAPLRAHPITVLGALPSTPDRPPLDRLQLGGVAALALAFLAAAGGWWGVSGTADPAEQLPYLASAGLAVGVFVAAGITFLIASEHARDRAVLGQVLASLAAADERAGVTESSLEALARAVDDLRREAPVAARAGTNGRAPRRRAPVGERES
jgi:hypothetical protein